MKKYLTCICNSAGYGTHYAQREYPGMLDALSQRSRSTRGTLCGLWGCPWGRHSAPLLGEERGGWVEAEGSPQSRPWHGSSGQCSPSRAARQRGLRRSGGCWRHRAPTATAQAVFSVGDIVRGGKKSDFSISLAPKQLLLRPAGEPR